MADNDPNAPAPEAEREAGPGPDPAPQADRPPAAETPVADPGPETANGPEAAAAPPPDTAILEQQVAELNDKLLRALAETENVRRRAERDREDAYKYAIANFARDVLSVADNLKRAMASVDAQARQSDPAVDKLMVGLELTEREMLATFERHGIKPVKALGERFDHNQHEALFEIEDRSRPAGTVVQELETGYLLNERLLRPAKVGVAKGGAKVETKAEAPPAAAEGPKKGGQAAYEPKGKEPGGKLDEKL